MNIYRGFCSLILHYMTLITPSCLCRPTSCIARINWHLFGLAGWRDWCSHFAMAARVVIKRWPSLTGSRCDMTYYVRLHTRCQRNYKGYTAIFSGSRNTIRLYRGDCPMCHNHVWIGGKSMMAVLTGSRYDITHMSACLNDSNEFPTVVPEILYPLLALGWYRK